MPGEETTRIQELGQKLNPRERKFVHEYLVDLKAAAAAERAGYSEKSAACQASRMLRKKEVREYRDALLQEQFDAIGVTKHSIAAEVWNLYQRCTEKVPVLEWDSETRHWEHKGVWQFDVKGALKALDMLGRMLPGMKSEEDEESFEDMLGGGGREF